MRVRDGRSTGEDPFERRRNDLEMAPKPIIPPEQLSEETRELFDLLNHEADLAVILIATRFLDACLKSILENHFLEGSTSERIWGIQAFSVR
ncbi:hypothetical protein NKH36_26135 [Mesorhizobium sp. M1312]|uniref:hypothetical protein n=1 Tax=unclassified Mesorhizobium TaxID=325217 RepID=UPI003336CC82